MFLGIVSLIAACLCWSLVFIIPLMMDTYHPVEIALGRFFCYGLISITILSLTKRKLFSPSYKSLWLKSSIYGFASTLLCFTSMVFSIRYAGSVTTTLIYSLSPLTIALYGNWKKKQYPYKKLFYPLVFMLAGIVLSNLKVFEGSEETFLRYLVGLLFSFIGLFSWTWFAVANSIFLENQKTLTIQEWSLMMGSSMLVIVLGCSACIVPLLSWKWTPFFITGSAVLGIVATWLAFLLWNYGSKRVPIALAGQMMILEVVFGLTLVYSYFKHWPTRHELLGMGLMTFGVLLSYKLLASTKKPSQAPT